MDRNKHIWEGWTIGNFIDDLEPQFDMIMNNQAWGQPFACRKDIKAWCKDNQPYYKKHIPEVANYFYKKAGV